MLCNVIRIFVKRLPPMTIQRRSQRGRLEERKVLKHLRELGDIPLRMKPRSDGRMSSQSAGPAAA